MTQFTVYSSTDASAPVLDGNGATNNLINLLDKILVAGYGSKAAAGWSHPFTGSTTEQVYRGGSGTQRYLHVLDDGSLTGGQRAAAIRCYETMAAVGDTTGLPFPTAAQETNGLSWRKSTTADGTARPWIAFADDRTLYLLIATGDTGAATTSAPYSWPMFMFGDFYSYTPTDIYNCMVIGVPSSQGFSASSINFTSSTVYEGDVISNQMTITGSVQTMVGHYIDRTLSGTQNSTQNYKKGANQFTAAGGATSRTSLAGLLDFPNGADGAAWLSPIYIMDSTIPEVVHGELRGCFHQLHDLNNFGDGDILTGAVGDQVARTFQVVKGTPHTSPVQGVWVFETSDTLRTN